ncbi:MAG: glycosyltransferase family 4 protein [Acidimicrobiales bacterium]|nr:glycosyltransferase family 4 protein [Acidimicrobiales bacterium]
MVARDLDPELRDRVDWRRLYVPPRIHLVQWAAARATVKRAMAGRSHDVVHVFQAQVAALADVYHVQYLSKPAQDAGSFPLGPGLRSAAAGAQLRAVAALEGGYLRHLGERPGLLFCSELLRGEFRSRYPEPRETWVLPNPNPEPIELSHEERDAARAGFVKDSTAPVWGYLGGWDERKGFRELFDALRLEPTAHLLFAGPGGPGDVPVDLLGRVTVLGRLQDLRAFFAAIDVLAVPSRFEPYGLVVGEAAAFGVPVVTSPAVGAAPLVERHHAGEVASGSAALAAALSRWSAGSRSSRAACDRLAAATSESALGPELLEVYGRAAR